jgi:hypothetical protein
MLVGVLLALIGALILLARLLVATPITIDVVNVWGVVPLLAGVAILRFRFGVILDRQKRTSTTWWGLLVPIHKSWGLPLSKDCYVSMASRSTLDPSKFTPLDNAFGALLPVNDGLSVRLEGLGGEAITLKDIQGHDEARRFAEEIAKFLNVALRDRSSGEEVFREAGKLDQPLREQLRGTGQSVPLPARIEDARAIFSHGGPGASTSIEMPPAGINARSALTAALAVCSVPLVFMMGFGKIRTSIDAGSLLYLLAALVLLGLVLVLPLLIRATTYREHLVVSPDEIVMTRHGFSGTKTTRLASAEVEEVAIVTLRMPRSFHDSMRRVVIRGDRGSIELGATLLNAEEVRWIRDVLIHVLAPASHDTEVV